MALRPEDETLGCSPPQNFQPSLQRAKVSVSIELWMFNLQAIEELAGGSPGFRRKPAFKAP